MALRITAFCMSAAREHNSLALSSSSTRQKIRISSLSDARRCVINRQRCDNWKRNSVLRVSSRADYISSSKRKERRRRRRRQAAKRLGSRMMDGGVFPSIFLSSHLSACRDARSHFIICIRGSFIIRNHFLAADDQPNLACYALYVYIYIL